MLVCPGVCLTGGCFLRVRCHARDDVDPACHDSLGADGEAKPYGIVYCWL